MSIYAGDELYDSDITSGPIEEDYEWTVCEGGCDRVLPADEAEHAQCGSMLVYCSDCLADHARTCLVCGAA